MGIDRRRSRFATMLLGLATAAMLGGSTRAQSPAVVAFAITHVTVIDGTGKPPTLDQTVLVERDRITAIGAVDAVRIPRGARTIDATGRFLIPGLWDAHIHTRYEGIDHLRLLIANGITSARNMSGPWEHLPQIHSWREQIQTRTRVGPRLLTTGPLLDGPGTGRAVQVAVNNADEARVAVRRVVIDTVEERRVRFDHCETVVRGLDAAGVTILAGTGGISAFQITGFSLQDELALLVRAGLSEMRAVQAATRNPAQVFNLTDQGTIENGKRADLVLLDANPLEHIENTKKIRLVVAAGRVFDRSDLDAILTDIERKAREWTGTPTR